MAGFPSEPVEEARLTLDAAALHSATVIDRPSRSYRALLAIPDLRRIVLAMQFARTAQTMTSVALVLFALAEYDSPALAGVVTAAGLLPGILISPLAGALLDRYGRVRLIRLDYLVAMGSMLLIGGLALAGLLTPALLIAIAIVASFTGPFSQTGLRSLFPLMVPEQLWERVNALDSNGYVIASIFGPPLAAGLVALAGAQVAVLAIAVPYAVAAVSTLGVHEPMTTTISSGRLLRDAWAGLRYSWSNRTIRGLIFAISALNLAGGIETIVVPLLIIERLGQPEWLVGVVFALSGVSGMFSALLFGRLDSHGREWQLLVYPMLPLPLVVALMLVAGSAPAVALPLAGVAVLGAAMFVFGLLNGPLDIGLFTIRQRRTDPAWIGRAFAVSMALNFVGYPIGAALAGGLADMSLELAVVAAMLATGLGAVFAIVLVPRSEPPRSTALTSP
jgi:MFS family permease